MTITSDYFYVNVPDWVIDSNISDGAYRLYAVLDTYSNRQGGGSHPSRKTIADRMGKSDRAIDRYIKELKGIGALTVTQRKSDSGKENLTNVYCVRKVPFGVAKKMSMGGEKNVDIPPHQLRHLATPVSQRTINHLTTNQSSVEDEFEQWWKHVPRKEAKGDARKAFKAARKKTSFDSLVSSIQRYTLTVRGKDKQYIKLPGGWLRDERWLDFADSVDPHSPSEPTIADVDKVLGRDTWAVPPAPEGLAPNQVLAYEKQARAEHWQQRLDDYRKAVNG